MKEKLLQDIRNMIISIECTKEQRNNILIKSEKILDEFIIRANKNELIVRGDTRTDLIASAIIYAVVVSNEDMPKISLSKLSKIHRSQITNYYRRNFMHLYPRVEFNLSSYNFNKIRQIFAIYFFKLILNRKFDIDISELVLHLKEEILKNSNNLKSLDKSDINALRIMATQHEDTFTKYFSDLIEIVRSLMAVSIVHKKIQARLTISNIAKFLEKDNINLLISNSGNFSRCVVKIFDVLKEHNPDFFPYRTIIQEDIDDYKKIVGSKIKLYVIENIFNGKYHEEGEGNCPECDKEGIKINITRLKALEFHHKFDKKHSFSAKDLYEMFVADQFNPNFLEDLIKTMESEEVVLKCCNHHTILHSKYYNYFKYLISWDKIFSFSAEIIKMLIRISVNIHRQTKNLSLDQRKEVRRSIRSFLKKRYIVESLYSEVCHTCGVFNVRRYLPAFEFNHLDENTKTVSASDLYKDHSCSEIVHILIQERGGYICANCHSVIHYDKYIPLLDKIFDNKRLVSEIENNYNSISKNFKIIYNASSIGDLLKTSKNVYDSFERYLTAIYEISKSNNIVTTSALGNYLGVKNPAHFFRNNRDFITPYINVEVGKGILQSIYTLTDKGKEVTSLIYHFRDYYSVL